MLKKSWKSNCGKVNGEDIALWGMGTILIALLLVVYFCSGYTPDPQYFHKFNNAKIVQMETKSVASGKTRRLEYYLVLEGKDYENIRFKAKQEVYESVSKGEVLGEVVIDSQRNELYSIERQGDEL
jgi:hypothetical protein